MGKVKLKILTRKSRKVYLRKECMMRMRVLGVKEEEKVRILEIGNRECQFVAKQQ